MNGHILGACVLIIAAVTIAGCTQGQETAATPAPASAATTTVPSVAATAAPQVSFSIGDHYLQKSYSFQSEKDMQTEQFRVDNPAWGIDFAVTPLNDDPQYCWFEMTVTNMDNGQKESYGYGRTYVYENHQQIPMYVTGPYKIEMKGNRVKVDLIAAKRNP